MLEIPVSKSKFRQWELLRSFGFDGFTDLENAQCYTDSLVNKIHLEERVIRQDPIDLNSSMQNSKFV